MKKGLNKLAGAMLSLAVVCSMLPAPASAAAAVSSGGQKEWLRQNAHELTSLESEDYSDLAFLKPLLKDKTVVSLGENFHQVAEYSSVKTRLIKFLHEEMDFDVIAFESGMGDAAAVFETRDSLTPEEMMKASIFPIWHSKETLELFDYIKEQGKGDDPLYLAGYDNQFTDYYLTQFIGGVIAKLDVDKGKAFAQMEIQAISDWYEVLNKYELFSKDPAYKKEMQAVVDKYVPQYQEVIKYVEQHRTELKAELKAVFPNQPKIDEIILKSLSDHVAFLESGLKDVKDAYSSRDELMTENLEWVMQTLYPGKKVILWAHNDHLAKNTSKMRVKQDGKWTNSFTSMGELMHRKLKDKMYVIGLYMNRGSSLTLSGKPFTIRPATKGSLEHLIMQSGYANSFIDLSQHKVKKGQNAWMFRPIYASEDGMTTEQVLPNVMRFIPKEQYDGIIVIDKVKAPTPVHSSNEESMTSE
ncbi:erythromycin esterase family protein [Paenibacillus oralis]|uniref:Erythromycin esterase family protein n=2 Tax=Paenibacillus oralis TaxID=2490856 RepID=A0A3P3UB31_9BACL|nr:erythromycin esterase family protein [Paenibacillus oralis]